ncbi:hypothetical protein R5R35_012124 [Gryllus longicercus]|uniref:Cytochrome P450 n=1 Tax=Gryllus longicercus TaxID=2509291 RepID=A0AAN9Z8G9_9ORTH
MLLSLAWFALGTLLVLPFYLLLWSRRARLTRKLPGPTPLPFLGSALELGRGPVEMMTNTVRLWRQYGSNIYKMWLGPELFVFVSNPNHLEAFMGCHINLKKSVLYKFLFPWLGEGLLTSSGKKWKRHRKIITPAFHFKILEQFVETFCHNSEILLRKLEAHGNGPAFNIYDYITLYALDVICETTFGVSVHAQENHQSQYVAAVKGMARVIMERTQYPWLFFDVTFRWSELRRKQEQYLKILHSTTNEVIQARKHYRLLNPDSSFSVDDTGVKHKVAFLDALLTAQNDGEKLTDEEIREEVDTFMFEGHDTISSAITFCLRLLGLHPNVQDRVYNELVGVFGNSKRKSTYRDLQDMKYLECVIKESLRLFPSVPFYGRRLEQDMKIDELVIPSGTNVGFMAYCMHRNPDIYPHPEKFDPDRFLPEKVQGRHPYAFLAFSAGPRNCIGQKFAMLQMKATISDILRRFKVITPSNVVIELSWEVVIRAPKGVFVKIEERS